MFQNTKETIWQISALAPKEWSHQKLKALSGLLNIINCLYFLFDHYLGARAEICQIFSLVISFWSYLTFRMLVKAGNSKT